jgi:hypothetical protein
MRLFERLILVKTYSDLECGDLPLWYYGRAYDRPWLADSIWYPVPLNFIVGIYMWCLCKWTRFRCWRTEWEKMGGGPTWEKYHQHGKEQYETGRTLGYLEGRSEGYSDGRLSR